MMSDSAAREILVSVWPDGSATAIQAAQSISRFEGNYGAAWGANNWGAIQCGSIAPCPPGCVEVTDSHANGEKYQGCFRIYDSPEQGALSFIKLLRKRATDDALNSGNADLIAATMRANGYFEAPVERYASAIASNAASIAHAMGETLLVMRADDMPAIPLVESPPSIATLGILGLLAYGAYKWRA